MSVFISTIFLILTQSQAIRNHLTKNLRKYFLVLNNEIINLSSSPYDLIRRCYRNISTCCFNENSCRKPAVLGVQRASQTFFRRISLEPCFFLLQDVKYMGEILISEKHLTLFFHGNLCFNGHYENAIEVKQYFRRLSQKMIRKCKSCEPSKIGNNTEFVNVLFFWGGRGSTMYL